MMKPYKMEDLVKVARRDNNKIRPYLLVNPLQGKHIPVSPEKVMELFRILSEQLNGRYQQEKLIIIGFAETATAIGAAVASNCPQAVFYLHTTREAEQTEEEPLYFSESHSHAVEQKLVVDRMKEEIRHADRIVFVEDEVTTGNTILKLIHEIKKRYVEAKTIKYTILSILNSMDEEIWEQFQGQGIDCLCLKRMKNRDFMEDLPRSYEENLKNPLCLSQNTEAGKIVSGKLNPRFGVVPSEYEAACEQLSQTVFNFFQGEKLKDKKILVLGTEEFMYPPLYTAWQLEKEYGCEVMFHATTRSPILPSVEKEYPIRTRFELRSIYETDRSIYLYNLKSYDLVIMIHDSPKETEEGKRSLMGALDQMGCQHIYMFQWRQ